MKFVASIVFSFCVSASWAQASDAFRGTIENILRSGVMEQARIALLSNPVTVTASVCSRSAGGVHDFYSEGDYWWPDPQNPTGPYVQQDGVTNPDNFTDHRKAMIRFSETVGALTSAWLLTKDTVYIAHAMKHVNAWFVDETTRMNPSLLYAQAIHGRVSGRGIGIIDTIHLMEVAQSLFLIDHFNVGDHAILDGAKQWFSAYLNWLTTHPYGFDEMNAKNNHGTCWTMQVASFARFTKNEQLLAFCRDRYKTILLPTQMAADGSFPLEIARTKPYGYSIFNLDAMATICNLLSTKQDNLWQYTTGDGRSILKGIAFLYPFIRDKSYWPFSKDVMYWEEWPVAQPSFLFAAIETGSNEWLDIWRTKDHFPSDEEVKRNLPIRNPLIWIVNLKNKEK